MTIVAARDLASKGIRVNTIAPGIMDTPLLARLREDCASRWKRPFRIPRGSATPTNSAVRS